MLECCALDAPPDRWFSPRDPSERGIHPRYRWATRALRLAGLVLTPSDKIHHLHFEHAASASHERGAPASRR